MARRKSRRGVTLIFVVSIIVMFMLLGATFAVVSANYFKSAQQSARQEVFNDPPQVALDRVLYLLLRGTFDSNSPFRGHSLAADKYAYTGMKINADSVGIAADSGNQFLIIETSGTPGTPSIPATATRFDNTNTTLSKYAGAYNGQEITFIEGPARGVTCRVVGYAFDEGTSVSQFFIMVENNDPHAADFFQRNADGTYVTPGAPRTDIANKTFILNPRAFVGKGAGRLRAPYTTPDDVPLNEPAFRGIADPDSPLRIYRGDDVFSGIQSRYTMAGVNESYDAPDFQNVFLSGQVQNRSSVYNDLYVVPSFHRPALLHYAAGQGYTTNAQLRPFFMGPMGTQVNSEFPGLNGIPLWNTANTITVAQAAANPMVQVGQVDCDNDYIAESLWIDPGFPVQTDATGRNYKILCAQLITDMDGKINVNAAGTKYQAGDPTAEPLAGYAANAQQSGTPLINSGGGNVSTASLTRRGQGVGPPEINLRPIFKDNTEFLNFIAGPNGRNGTNTLPGITGQDPLLRSQLYGYPAFGNFTGNWAASFFDINGRSAVGIDINGAPRFDTSTLPNEYADNPYELNLLSDAAGIHGNSKDGIFSVGDLERILRPYDIDAGTLPDRLWNMTQRFYLDNSANRDEAYRTRRSVTTHSFDMPVPNDDVAKRLTDILAASGIASDPVLNSAGDPAEVVISNHVSGMLDRDVLMGLRMNVNWAFGNGLDDNANLVRDEASEAPTEMINGIPFDHNLDGLKNGADIYARQHFARKLFVLALLFNQDLVMDLDDGSFEDDGIPTRIEARKIIAQWVANVIDFRDSDAIMTHFEFDLNPFDGWHLDSVPFTDETASGNPPPTFETQPSRFVVWGCERPELLITESVAAHDRRTEDRDDDRQGNNGNGVGQGPPSKDTTDPMNPDEDFDQRVRPRGLTYLEFYNPWNSTTEVPMELYTNNGTKVGVDLKKLTPVGNSPIWRVLVVKDGGKALDPDTHSLAPADRILAADKERSIYFCPIANTAAIPASEHGVAYVPDPAVLPSIGLIGIQEYAVVGSAGTENGGVYTMPIGMRRDADLMTDLKIPQTRRIELEPAANRFRIHQTDGAGALVTQTRTCVAIPVADFSVSEPPGGYMTPNDHTYQDNGLLEFSYMPTVDTPFDRDRPDSAFFDQDGNVTNFREVHLQRLANPLEAFHPIRNPYRTIDSHSVDMTVFNGIDENDLGQTEEQATGWVVDDNIEFSSLERGEHEIDLNLSPAQSRKLWKHERNSTHPGSDDAPAPNDGHFFSYNLVETVGELNVPYDLSTPKFAGNPVAFPWMNWNNRPFISQLELMMVPKSRSSRLLHDVTFERNNVGIPYAPPAPTNAQGIPQVAEYGHLLNFFQSSNAANEGPNLHRLFEYTHVPSMFAGTQHQLNAAHFTGNSQASGINGFNAPYNQISSYRNPGQLNLNTIFQRQVYEAMWGHSENTATNYRNGFDNTTAIHQGNAPTWGEFVESRGGYNGVTSAPQNPPGTGPVVLSTASAIRDADATMPTFFGNPFRAAGEHNMVPALATANQMVRPESETGLLRSDQQVSFAGSSHVGRKPLFDMEKRTTQQQPYNDDDRNPFFRYESIQRLENLTTTRSNVYGIWITIGYFEVDQNGKLGKELGSDTGKAKRHRMFSMVDRSIPFAFEPGKNHNIDRIILSKRYIE